MQDLWLRKQAGRRERKCLVCMYLKRHLHILRFRCHGGELLGDFCSGRLCGTEVKSTVPSADNG